MSSMNSQQELIIREVSHPCLVIAGAGCGKTFTICQKIREIVRSYEAVHKKVLAITFTNKAARELKNRLISLGVPGKAVHVSTFHRFGLMLLQKYYQLVHLKKNFSLIDQQDKILMLQNLYPALAPGLREELSLAISMHKHNFYAKEIQLHDSFPLAFLDYFNEYDTALTSMNMVDLDDLVYKAAIISQSDEVQHHMLNVFGYWFIDEYQDTNVSQYYLFKNLAPHNRFTVVGDDDQSIYTWRGANPENLKMMADDFKGLKIFKLEENFRSSPEILKAANLLIKSNDHLFEKTLWSNKPSQTAVVLKTYNTDQEEIETIVNEIESRLNDKKSIAILFRTNFQMIGFEKQLKQQRISYDLLGAVSIFNSTEIKDIVCYLRIILNPDDDQAFKRIINIPKRGLGTQTLGSLVKYASERSLSLFHASAHLNFLNKNTEKNKFVFEQFHTLIDSYREKMHTSDDLKWLWILLDEIEYKDWLESLGLKKAQVDKRLRFISDFFQWIQQLYTKSNDLGQVLNKIMIIDMLDKEEKKKDSRLTLSTIHASKGLEYDEVYIPYCVDGIIPHHQSINDHLAEERRLLYVAMTRARSQLTLSYAKTIGGKDTLKSQFLDEIDSELSQSTKTTEEPLSWEQMRMLLGM